MIISYTLEHKYNKGLSFNSEVNILSGISYHARLTLNLVDKIFNDFLTNNCNPKTDI